MENDKSYYEKNREYILFSQRARYASDGSYRENTLENSKQRYAQKTDTQEGRQMYNEKMKLYMREYRKRKKNS